MIIIAHLDMDAFFAAVEERDKPRLKGRPIVIGADPLDGRGRGVVSTANYAARKYGIHSALPIQTAWRLAKQAETAGQPKTVFMSGSFRRYSAASQKIMKILSSYSSEIQQVGVDEAYFKISENSFAAAKKIAIKIKKAILNKENLTCSIGIGPNKLIAKIASDHQKPDGLTVVGADDEKTCAELAEAFLAPLPIRVIPGVGPKAEQTLHGLKIKTIKDLKRFSAPELEKIFGKWGVALYEKSRGIGSTSLVASGPRKSIGEETTFRNDSLNAAEITVALKKLCQDVFKHLNRSEFRFFRTIVLKVRFSDFVTRSRSKTFATPIKDLKTLEFESLRLILPFFEKKENPRRKSLRLIGVRLEKLS